MQVLGSNQTERVSCLRKNPQCFCHCESKALAQNGLIQIGRFLSHAFSLKASCSPIPIGHEENSSLILRVHGILSLLFTARLSFMPGETLWSKVILHRHFSVFEGDACGRHARFRPLGTQVFYGKPSCSLWLQLIGHSDGLKHSTGLVVTLDEKGITSHGNCVPMNVAFHPQHLERLRSSRVIENI